MTNQVFKNDLMIISLFNFLLSLEDEKKTCLVQVSSKDKLGFLYFFAGKLVDAVCDDYDGEAAAYAILAWNDIKIELMDIVRKDHHRIIKITKPLQKLLAEATNLHTNSNKSTIDEQIQRVQKEINMGNVNECLAELMKVDGAMATSVVDAKSGMMVGMAGGGINLELAAAGNSEVVRAKLKTMHTLGLKDKIEDILITLGQHYHLIRPLNAAPNLFIYFVLNRAQANLAMARHKLAELESRLEI